MLQAFKRLLSCEGRGLLSGLLVNQAPTLKQVLSDLGWQVTREAEQGRWGLLEIQPQREFRHKLNLSVHSSDWSFARHL